MSLFDTTINELGATTGLAMTQALNEVIAQVERAKSDAWRIRKQSTAYTVGDIVIVPGLKNHGLALECMQEGTSWAWELELTEPTVGDVIEDNTIQWKVIPMVSAVGGLTPEQIATELSSLEQDLNDTITQTAQSLSSAISQAETNAKDYTDDTEANLSSAISTAETNAKNYTDGIAENLTEAIATAETNAKGYTDTETAKLLPLAGGTITGDLEVNGDLTTDGKKVLTETDNITVVEAYNDGTNWYRVWSDGWIEQGGRIESASQTNKIVFTLTLHKAYRDMQYNVQFTGGYGSDGGADIWTGVIKSTTTVEMTGYDRSTSGTVGGFVFWRACGF